MADLGKSFMEAVAGRISGAEALFLEHFNTAAGKTGMISNFMKDDLLSAVEQGDVTKVKALLRMKADPDAARDGSGETALMIAVRRADEKMVEELLDGGANPDATDGAGNTALIFAAAGGSLSIAKLLIKKFADISAVNMNSETALDIAIGKNPELAAVLEAKRQAHIFNRVVRMRKAAQKHKEALKRAEDNPIMAGLAEGIFGAIALFSIARFSKFHKVLAPVATVAAADLKETPATSSAALVSAPTPEAPRPAQGA